MTPAVQITLIICATFVAIVLMAVINNKKGGR